MREIARARGARTEVQLQAHSAVFSVFESGRVETITVVSQPQIDRLDRMTATRSVLARAADPRADLEERTHELVALTERAAPYPVWLSMLGVVPISVGFSVSVQARRQELAVSTATRTLVAVITSLAARSPRFDQIAPFLSAVAVSTLVFAFCDDLDLAGGAILFVVPALFFCIPGDVLSASMFDLAEGRITAGSTQLVYSVFVIVVLSLGVVFAAGLTSTDGPTPFGDPAPADLPTSARGLVGWSSPSASHWPSPWSRATSGGCSA